MLPQLEIEAYKDKVNAFLQEAEKQRMLKLIRLRRSKKSQIKSPIQTMRLLWINKGYIRSE